MVETEVQRRKLWLRGARWAAGFVTVVALLEGGHAAWSAYDASDASGHSDGPAGQSWANLKRCLVGDAGDVRLAADPLARLRRGLELADPAGQPEGATSFPQRCARHAIGLSESLVAAGQWAFVGQVDRAARELERGAVDDDLGMLWISLEGSLPLREPDPSVPLPPELPTELVPLTSITPMGDESVGHTVSGADPSNGGPLTIRFGRTRRTCMFADDLRSARCVSDHDALPETLFRSPTFGSSPNDGAPWLSFRHFEGEKLYDVSTGDVLYQAAENEFFEGVLATRDGHWILQSKPVKRLVRRNAEGKTDEWTLPAGEGGFRLVGDFALSTQPSGAHGTRIVARRLPEGDGELGPAEPILERPFSLSISTSRYAHRHGDTLRQFVDAPTNKLLITYRDGTWSEMEVDDPSDATVSFDESAVHSTWAEATYVEVKTCREAGCRATSYEARLADKNVAVRLGDQIALLGWDSDDVWLTLAKPDALATAPRRALLTPKYMRAARVWSRGDKALVILDTARGTLSIGLDATGDVWPVRIEDDADRSAPQPATPKHP